MTGQRRLRPGQEPKGRVSLRLGDSDPRARRNDSADLSDLGIDPPLVQSKRNRITIDLDSNFLSVDAEGRLTLSGELKEFLGIL